MASTDYIRERVGDRYQLERELGRGGMGAVYLARETRLDRPVALKVLPAEYTARPALRERFLRETRTAAGFSHPNIVPVYAVEESDDFLAYVMGFVEGETLAERVARAGPLTPRETARLLQDVAYALAYAHGRGVVHRDIKPDNVMIERATGRALVMDFGIARPIAAAPVASEGLTRVGEVVGTPEYMSPEQATGDAVDGRTDIYALGLTAHFVLTGRAAFAGGSTPRVLARQIAEPLSPIGTIRPDVPPALARVIDRCVAKDPADRYQRAEELVDDLDAAQLSAPEIPLAIRLFAYEISTLSLIFVGAAILSFFIVHSAAMRDMSDLDTLLPVVVVIGVVVARFVQTFRHGRRLGRQGFSRVDVERGLRAVMDERAASREQLRMDPETRAARRRTIFWGASLFVLSLLLVRAAFDFRTPVAPGQYQVAVPGVILIASGLALLGTSVALLLRSPFRMSAGEVLFGIVWLGPFGRLFVRLATRGSHGVAAGSAPPTVAALNSPATLRTPAAAAIPRDAADRLRSLEERVAALEGAAGLRKAR